MIPVAERNSPAFRGRVVSVDPGRSKCGLLLADCSRQIVIDGLVVEAEHTAGLVARWHQQEPITTLVLGNGTSSEQWHAALKHVAPVVRVNEAGTTLRARSRYWQIWPARGWRKLLPQGLRLPPCELDAIAALVFLEDQLGEQLRWPSPPLSGPGLRTWLEL